MRQFSIPAFAAVGLLALPALVALPALAATTGSTEPSATTTKDTTQVQQQLRQDLSKAGYSDIRIMPGSFLVQAKDRQGNETEMMISPHSMTEVTAMGTSDSTTHNGNNGSASADQTSK